MFNRKTVIILGAGSSKEYGFPTGAELQQQIAEGVRYRFQSYEGRVSGDEELLEALQTTFRGDEVNAYTKAGNKLADVMKHSFKSVDEALHYYANEPAVIKLGKMAIAHFILRAERECEIGKRDTKTGLMQIEAADDSWLPHFFSMALSMSQHAAADDMFENVTFVNFNYDRSLEHYLYLSLQQRAGFSEERARKVAGKLRVIRPYGSLGKLPWQDDKAGVAFGGGGNLSERLHEISTKIRTYAEQHQTDLENNLTETLQNAALILILGFGFHQQNMAPF